MAVKVTRTFTAPVRGIGKPDYTREISSGRERPGLTLAYGQTLEIFGIVFTSINTGVHIGIAHLTIMTDPTAHFTINALINLVIVNVTDGSYGVIIANTETTVTVAGLIGGISNQWNNLDVYNIPSPFPWVTTPLAIGATAHFVDTATGVALPYTIPAGYTLTLIAAGWGFTEDAIAWVYLDGILAMTGGVMTGGQSKYESRIIGISSATVDPTGATSHTFDIQVTNRGGGTLEGSTEWNLILEAVGTKPLPTTKTVKCKHCGNEKTVPLDTSQVICSECGKLTIYYNLSRFRGTP